MEHVNLGNPVFETNQYLEIYSWHKFKEHDIRSHIIDSIVVPISDNSTLSSILDSILYNF